MSKKMYFHPEYTDSYGVDVTYRKKGRKLFIGGWYDSMVGIPSQIVTLGAFLTGLGITLKDCEKALKEATV